MITLGLLGRDIQHSESPLIYRKLLECQFNYRLFDIDTIDKMPCLDEIFEQVDGLSITAPYKRIFYGKVELVDQAKDLKAINCIAKREGKYVGANTDILAMQDLLEELLLSHPIDGVIIIGDGVMASIAEKIVSAKGIVHKMVSRKRGDDLGFLELNSPFGPSMERLLVINACGRSYIFKGTISSKTIFWNLNYSQSEQEKSVAPMVYQYIDGVSLLELQAKYSLKFWGLRD